MVATAHGARTSIISVVECLTNPRASQLTSPTTMSGASRSAAGRHFPESLSRYPTPHTAPHTEPKTLTKPEASAPCAPSRKAENTLALIGCSSTRALALFATFERPSANDSARPRLHRHGCNPPASLNGAAGSHSRTALSSLFQNLWIYPRRGGTERRRGRILPGWRAPAAGLRDDQTRGATTEPENR